MADTKTLPSPPDGKVPLPRGWAARHVPSSTGAGEYLVHNTLGDEVFRVGSKDDVLPTIDSLVNKTVEVGTIDSPVTVPFSDDFITS